MPMTTFRIPDMSCGHCRATIEKTIHGLDPAATLDFDMPAHTVAVQTGRETEAVRAALSEAGYPATVA